MSAIGGRSSPMAPTGRIEIERMPLNALTVHAILISTLTMMREAVHQARNRSVHPDIIVELIALAGLIDSARINLADHYMPRRYKE